jgi:hypothetical protein
MAQPQKELYIDLMYGFKEMAEDAYFAKEEPHRIIEIVSKYDYIELTPPYCSGYPKDINQKLYALGKSLGKPVVAQFRQVMNEPEFAGKFRLLVFAILESTRKPNGLNGNFAPFYHEFGTYTI